MTHAFNPNTQEAETGKSLNLNPVWSAEFQDSQSRRETLSQKHKQINK